MSEPLISVVMPLRNAATTLAETLDSIQSQTLHNIEVIMIDDFSEDDTRLIAEAICNSDQTISLYPGYEPWARPGAKSRDSGSSESSNRAHGW